MRSGQAGCVDWVTPPLSEQPLLNEDFEDMLRVLLEAEVEFLVVGAHAL